MNGSRFLAAVFGVSAIVGFTPREARAACEVMDAHGARAARTHDAIGELLFTAPKCPTDVFQFRALLLQRGMRLETTMVANRGFHAPNQGSFSLFEMVTDPARTGRTITGEFFFGHFTGVGKRNELIADQSPANGSLMIEALAWDTTKRYFNFYELRGNGIEGQWFYRGDSVDILADNRLLHRQPVPARPVFGDRLRCSGCHSSGGPIMKELYPPHNDWWKVARPLPLGGRTVDGNLADILKTLVPADRLAVAVATGIAKLETSPTLRSLKARTPLPERLRPLFCPVEINFQSDPVPNSTRPGLIHVPTGFFADPRLLSPKIRSSMRLGLTVDREKYMGALANLGSRFPDTVLPDGDHAWLAPVKGNSDQLAIDGLIRQGVIDAEFAADVLAVDFSNPVTSRARCSLLRFVPTNSNENWMRIFGTRLSRFGSPAALELLRNMSDPARDLEFHQARVEKYLSGCQSILSAAEDVAPFVLLLDQRRNEVRESEISRNPLGQILEPGFRVIFPKLARSVAPGRFELSEAGEPRLARPPAAVRAMRATRKRRMAPRD